MIEKIELTIMLAALVMFVFVLGMHVHSALTGAGGYIRHIPRRPNISPFPDLPPSSKMPIPLTAEILEKSGFRKDRCGNYNLCLPDTERWKYRWVWVDIRRHYVEVRRSDNNDDSLLGFEGMRVSGVHTVRQLESIFRLFEIDKQINNEL